MSLDWRVYIWGRSAYGVKVLKCVFGDVSVL